MGRPSPILALLVRLAYAVLTTLVVFALVGIGVALLRWRL